MNEVFHKWRKEYMKTNAWVIATYEQDMLAAWEAATPQWQSMETAPKDKRCIGLDIYGRVTEIKFLSGHWVFHDEEDDYEFHCFYPVFWQPLPEPPKK